MALISLNLPAPATPMRAPAQPYNLAGLNSVLVGMQTASGQYVNQETALRASAVLACIRILCEDISQLPLHLYRRTARGSYLASENPLYRKLHDAPNPWQTSLELREGIVLDMLLYGQSFCEKLIGPYGIEGIFPLQAARVQFFDCLPDGTLRWRYSDPQGGVRILLADDLWRNNLLAGTGTIEGRSLVLLAREAIGLALAAEEQGARLFSNGVQTNIVIESPDSLDDEQKENLRESFSRRHAGTANAWRAILLEGGLKATRIGLTAEESQYIESRGYQTSDIARIFRIPDVLLGIQTGKTATFASAEQFFLSYVKHTIQPWVRRIEQTIARDLIPASEANLYAKHDLDALLRADLKTRYDAHRIGIESGFLTRNEARAVEDLPMLDGLDEPVQPKAGNANQAQALAQQLAKNCVAHEEKLLADGKPAQDVYTKLLPGYLRDKAALSAAQCAEYCNARLAGALDGVELLTTILIAS
jgi:HK97 family phage portal protein